MLSLKKRKRGDDIMTQGERIRELRKALKLTLDRFGERVGVKKSALSQIENGKVVSPIR